jgi:DNA-binding MarR family transcriptional regulator
MTKISNKLKFLMLLSKTESVVSRKLFGGGLGFGDLAVLYAINQAPDGRIRRTDLAEQVGLTASGVTRLLVPLEKTGVIHREAHERDARVSYAVMTKAGRELFVDSLKWIEMKCDELLPDEQAKKIEPASDLLETLAR